MIFIKNVHRNKKNLIFNKINKIQFRLLFIK